MDNINRWEDEIQETADYAVNVYNDNLRKLVDEWSKEVDRDEREIKHVEREVAVDAWFAVHHLEYLAKVVEREAKHLNRLFAKLANVKEEDDEKKFERLSERVEKHIDEANEHVEKVAKHVVEHIERDAKAAARHVLHGLKKLGKNAEDYDKVIERSTNEVVAAVQAVVDKVREED